MSLAPVHYQYGGPVYPKPPTSFLNFNYPSFSSAGQGYPVAMNRDGTYNAADLDNINPFHYIMHPLSMSSSPQEYDRGYYSLPDNFRGSHQDQAKYMITRITKDDAFYLKCLPPKNMEDAMDWRVDIMKFHDHLMDRGTEETAPTMVRSTKYSKQGGMIRYHKACEAEHSFAKTPNGIIHMLMSVLQIEQAMLRSMCWVISKSLLSVPHHRLPNPVDGHTGTGFLTPSQFEHLLDDEVQSWAGLQKLGPWAFDTIWKKHDQILTDRGVTESARLTVLPRGTREWIETAPELTQFLHSGKASTPSGSIGGGYGSIYSSKNLGPEDEAYDKNPYGDPFFQNRTIGQYNFMNNHHLQGIDPDNYETRFRSIIVYDHDTDDFAEISIRTAFKYSGLFKLKAPHDITNLGKKVYGDNRKWYDLLKEHGIHQHVVSKSVSKIFVEDKDEFKRLCAAIGTPHTTQAESRHLGPAHIRAPAGVGLKTWLYDMLPSFAKRWNDTLDARSMLQAAQHAPTTFAHLLKIRAKTIEPGHPTAAAAAAFFAGDVNRYNNYTYLGAGQGFANQTPVLSHSAEDEKKCSHLIANSALFSNEAIRLAFQDDYVALLGDVGAKRPNLRGNDQWTQYIKPVLDAAAQVMLDEHARTAAHPRGSPALQAAVKTAMDTTYSLTTIVTDPSAQSFLPILRVYAENLAWNYASENHSPGPFPRDFRSQFFKWAAVVLHWYLAGHRAAGRERDTFFDFLSLSTRREGHALFEACQALDQNNIAGSVAGVIQNVIRLVVAAVQQELEVAAASHTNLAALLNANPPNLQEIKREFEGLLKNSPVRNAIPFYIWLENNIDIPFACLIASPHQCFKMGSGLIMVPGYSTGFTAIGFADMMWTDDATLKLHFGHFSAYMQPVITDDTRVVVMHNIFSSDYRGGGGIKFWPYTEVDIASYRNGNGHDNEGKSLFVLTVPGWFDPRRKYIDITGSYNTQICQSGGDSAEQHYPTAPIYRQIWGWNHGIRTNNPSDYFRNNSPSYNTVCCQGYQRMFRYEGKGQGTWDYTMRSKGHFGDPYPGMGAWVRGARRAEPLGYTPATNSYVRAAL